MPDEDDDDDDDDDDDPDEVVVVEITDELDLHTFHPRDVKALVTDYLDECRARGFAEVRVIHGKGIGELRRIVHAVCETHPAVASFALADGARGSWGATIVRLKKDPL